MTEAKRSKQVATNAVTRAKNATAVAKGRAKATTGKALGDRKLEMTGELEGAKGKAEQIGQKFKESLDA